MSKKILVCNESECCREDSPKQGNCPIDRLPCRGVPYLPAKPVLVLVLVRAARGFLDATRKWNTEVERIIGRTPETGIPLDALAAAIRAVEEAGK